MKSICLTIASLLSIAVMSQSLISPPQIYEGYYNLNNQSLSYRQLVSEGGLYYQDSSLWNTQGYKAFSRTQQFWDNRASSYGDTVGGTSHVEKASITLLQSTIACDLNATHLPNWQFLGPDESQYQNLGIIQSLALDPLDVTNNTLYAGTNASGLWKTENAMSSQPLWENITESTNLPGLGIQDIAIDPLNSNIIYIATGVSTYSRSYGVGILKTTDGGQNWQIVYGISPSQNKSAWKILIDSDNPNIIYAGAGSDIIRSFDFGNTWDVIYTDSSGSPFPLIADHIIDLEFDLTDLSRNILYASTRKGAEWSLSKAKLIKILNCKSLNPIVDTNITQPSFGKEVYNIATTPSEPQNLYLMDGTIYVSSNGGSTWQNVAYPSTLTPTPFDYYNYKAFGVSPNNSNVFYAGNTVILKADLNNTNQFNVLAAYSTDGSNNVHADIRAMVLVDLGSEDGVFLGTDGGISFSASSGSTWQNLNGKGLQITQFYKLGGAEKYPNLLLAGTQDNGTKRLNNGSWQTNYVTGGDGYECLIDGNNPNIYYTIGNNTVYKSSVPVFSPLSNGYIGANMTFHGANYDAITYSKKDVRGIHLNTYLCTSNY